MLTYVHHSCILRKFVYYCSKFLRYKVIKMYVFFVYVKVALVSRVMKVLVDRLVLLAQLVNRVKEVYLVYPVNRDHKVHLDPKANRVSRDRWVLKENVVLRAALVSQADKVNRVSVALLVSQDQQDSQGRLVNQD